MRATLRDAVCALQARWGSGLLAPLRLCGAMACVELPAALQSSPPGTADSAAAKEVQVCAPALARTLCRLWQPTRDRVTA